MAKDRELQDHERAHSGKPGSAVRHGNDATGRMWSLEAGQAGETSVTHAYTSPKKALKVAKRFMDRSKSPHESFRYTNVRYKYNDDGDFVEVKPLKVR